MQLPSRDDLIFARHLSLKKVVGHRTGDVVKLESKMPMDIFDMSSGIALNLQTSANERENDRAINEHAGNAFHGGVLEMNMQALPFHDRASLCCFVSYRPMHTRAND